MVEIFVFSLLYQEISENVCELPFGVQILIF